MWNERYAEPGYLFGTAPAAFLVAHADLLEPGQSALVVADGEGRNSVFLAERGLHVTAFDNSTVGVEKAQQLAAEREVHVDFNVADILEWDWSGRSYDLVVAIFIQFLPPSQRADVFDGLRVATAPGGRLLLHGYRPEQVEYGTGGPPHPENMYTEELLRESFNDLSIERLAGYDATIEEGSGHVGRSALIDLVAHRPPPG